jgi:hypothetical protein
MDPITILAAAVVALLCAHVAASFVGSLDSARLAAWAECDSLDADTLDALAESSAYRAELSYAAEVDAAVDGASSVAWERVPVRAPSEVRRVARLVASAIVSARPALPSVAPPMPSDDLPTVRAPAPSTAPDTVIDHSAAWVEYATPPAIPASERPRVIDYSVPIAAPDYVPRVRLAFDALTSARDAAIQVRVACTVRDRIAAERWRTAASMLVGECRAIATETGAAHAARWAADADRTLASVDERIDRTWPAPVRVVVERVSPMLPAAPTFRALAAAHVPPATVAAPPLKRGRGRPRNVTAASA